MLSFPVVICLATVLIISGMFSDENGSQTWLDRGAEAFANLQFAEAMQDFEKAVAADPQSAKAHLSLGAMYLFAYQNGVSKEPDLPPDWVDRLKSLPPGATPSASVIPPPRGKSPKRSAQIAEQNSTNGARAEEHLKKALEIQPHYEAAMEYLAALYFWWRDPPTELWARRDDARQWYARIAENNPQHGFARYACGVIDYEKAFVVIRSTPGFPRPLADEESRRSLRAKVGPLLDDSAVSFLRSLDIDPNNSEAMTYLGFVKSDQAYIAESMDDSVRLRAEAAEWYGKVNQIMEAHAKATGQSWPPGDTGTIVFERTPGKPVLPPFPPDARFMLPLAPPPPPPPAAFR